jgi:hypothetical protein
MTRHEDRLALHRAQRMWFLSDAAVKELTLHNQLEHHHEGACPRCGAEGWYLRSWWGRRHHPTCGARWVEPPNQWGLSSLRGVGGASLGALTDPTTAVHHGCTGLVVGGCASLVIGMPLVVLLLPLQATVWLLTPRPKPFPPDAPGIRTSDAEEDPT